MPKEKKHALVLGGGLWQVPIIDYLKSRGDIVTAIDPVPDCAGGLAGNHHLRVDARDAEAILKAVPRGQFAYVTSDQSDMATDAVAKVSRGLGLIGNSPEAVLRFTDKTKCRELAASAGLPQPQFTAARSAAEVRQFMASRPSACIVKPADSQSSRGVTRLERADDPGLEAAVQTALSFSHAGKVIVEDFIDGKEITVEGLCSGGRHRCLAMSIKDHFRMGIANKLRYPAELPADLEERVFKAMDAFVENSGLAFGITHAEFIVDIPAKKFWLVEIACRGGGTLISSDIAPWVSGVDFYAILYDNLNGRTTDLKALRRQTNGALLGFFEFGEGLVEKIDGLEQARSWPGVFRLELAFKTGDRLQKASDDRSRQGFAILLGKSSAEVETLWEKVRANVKVHMRRPA